MDWTADSEMTKAQLMRLVALLLGLSALAERACRAPLRVRVEVMGFLMPAELVAWDFVARGLPEQACGDDGPEAAMRLAVRFRALAMILAAIAVRLDARSRVRIGMLPRAVEAAGNVVEPGRVRLLPFDTS